MRYLVFVLALFALSPSTAHDTSNDQANVCASDTMQASDALEGIARGISVESLATSEPSVADVVVIDSSAFYAVPGVVTTPEPTSWPSLVLTNTFYLSAEIAPTMRAGDCKPSGFAAPARMNC